MLNYVKNIVQELELDLSGKIIVTECASGSYSFTPLIALIANAKRVICYGTDSSYGTYENNKNEILRLINLYEIPNRAEFCNNRESLYNFLEDVDIVTNSGMLRPIDKDFISCLPNKSVICLMWETWEMREGEIDLLAAKDKSIPIIGTNESFSKLSMYGVPTVLFFKMVLENNFSITHDNFILLGGGLTGELIANDLKALNLRFDWYTANGDSYSLPYRSLGGVKSNDYLDFVFVADHTFPQKIFTDENGLSLKDLKEKFPKVKVIHLCGNVPQKELEDLNISFFPNKISPFGYMSYQSADFNDKPVIALNAMGLKVGQVYNDSFLSGLSKEAAIDSTVKLGIGMSLKN